MNARDTMPPMPAQLVEATLADVTAVREELAASIHAVAEHMSTLEERLEILDYRLDQLAGPL